MTKLYNKASKKPLRQQLRSNMPLAEKLLWEYLRSEQLGHKFRRQYSVDRYILDFYCRELRLAIEIDGDSHFVGDAPMQDKIREGYLEDCGIQVIRFTNSDIYNNLDGVLVHLQETIKRIVLKEG